MIAGVTIHVRPGSETEPSRAGVRGERCLDGGDDGGQLFRAGVAGDAGGRADADGAFGCGAGRAAEIHGGVEALERDVAGSRLRPGCRRDALAVAEGEGAGGVGVGRWGVDAGGLAGGLGGQGGPGVVGGASASRRRPGGRRGCRAACRWAKAAVGSSKNITPKRENSRSNGPGRSALEASASANVRLVRPDGAAAGDGQHGGGDIDAEDLAGRADQLGECQGGVAAAAADIEDVLARRGAGGGEGGIAEGADQLVRAFLFGRPAFTNRAVPVGYLQRIVTGHVILLSLRVTP